MKFFTSKEATKKIIIAVLLVMTFNFIAPVTSQADFGGALFKPISQLLGAIADLFIETLQGYFMGDSNIESEIPDSEGVRKNILYFLFSWDYIFRKSTRIKS